MGYYFAFGSNMSRARLEARVSLVRHYGHGVLEGYAHRFSHRGSDGTGKGNIERAPNTQVHGVVYRLMETQWEALHPFERGYELRSVEILLGTTATNRAGTEPRIIQARTYVSLEVTERLHPTSDYFAHYQVGMAENDLPSWYIQHLHKQAGK